MYCTIGELESCTVTDAEAMPKEVLTFSKMTTVSDGKSTIKYAITRDGFVENCTVNTEGGTCEWKTSDGRDRQITWGSGLLTGSGTSVTSATLP